MEEILIIDDDVALCGLVTEYLQSLGFHVEALHRGDIGAKRALEGRHSIILLDVMLAGLERIECSRKYGAPRKYRTDAYSPRGRIDRIVGLEIGRTITSKAFNPRELAARIRGSCDVSS